MPKLTEFQPYEWRPGMGEISGFGGGYEAACRAMVKAGCEWFEGHPDAKPVFRGLTGVYGLLNQNNPDAAALDAAVVAAAPGCSGAMHHACINACLYIHAHGWEKYVEAMSDPHRK
jgi:hypothetical protein